MGFSYLKLVQASLFSLLILSTMASAAANIQGQRFQDWGELPNPNARSPLLFRTSPTGWRAKSHGDGDWL